MIPGIRAAIVIAQDPPGGGLAVQLKNSNQIINIKMGYDGMADAFRINQKPLPSKGTWGLVAFVDGDIRNGVWLKSYYPSQTDAILSDTGDPFDDYTANWAGGVTLERGSDGAFFKEWPDGTQLIVGPGTDFATIHRHIVNPDQTQDRKVVSAADRVPAPPDPFTVTVVTASGTTVQVASTGAVSVLLPSSEPLIISQGGAPATDHLTLVSLLCAFFNAHVHPDGGGNTGPPVVPMTPPDVESTIIEISN